MTWDRTIACLEQQVECYRRLAKLAEIQHVHVEQNRTDALLDVLQARREMLDEISRLEETLGPARRQWSDRRDSIDPQQRTRVEALLSETRQLLEQITTADRNDVMVLQQHKLNLGRQIKSALAARSVNRTYGAASYGQAGGQSKMDLQQ